MFLIGIEIFATCETVRNRYRSQEQAKKNVFSLQNLTCSKLKLQAVDTRNNKNL